MDTLIEIYGKWQLCSYQDIASQLVLDCPELSTKPWSAEECAIRLHVLYALSPEKFSSEPPPLLLQSQAQPRRGGVALLARSDDWLENEGGTGVVGFCGRGKRRQELTGELQRERPPSEKRGSCVRVQWTPVLALEGGVARHDSSLCRRSGGKSLGRDWV